MSSFQRCYPRLTKEMEKDMTDLVETGKLFLATLPIASIAPRWIILAKKRLKKLKRRLKSFLRLRVALRAKIAKKNKCLQI